MLYVILTRDIHPIGGMQMYVAAKTKYLQAEGWDIAVIFSGASDGECLIHSLDAFLNGGILEISLPPYAFSKPTRTAVINEMLSIIDQRDNGEMTIIESQDDSTSQWGELLAIELQAKHVCFNCNECFRGADKHYEPLLDFYDFKHRRRELAGISSESLGLLFEGYKEITETENYVFFASPGEAVQDVADKRLEQIEQCDFTIAYIGRLGKGYFPGILLDISKFALQHPCAQIQCIIVGDYVGYSDMIQRAFCQNDNVQVKCMGDMVPIPTQLFKHCDVVIAGSGCVLCSARQGVPVIVADAGNYRSNGIFGLDTNSILYAEDEVCQTDFVSSIERVFSNRDRILEQIQLPNFCKDDSTFEKHFEFINASVSRKTYFDPDRLCEPNRNAREASWAIKFFVARKFPKLVTLWRRANKRNDRRGA